MIVQVSTVVRLPQRLKYTFLKTSFFTSQFLPNSEFSLWNKTLPGASLNCAFIKDFGPLWREHIVDKSVFHSDARSNDMSTHKGTCCSAIASTTTSYKISSLVKQQYPLVVIDWSDDDGGSSLKACQNSWSCSTESKTISLLLWHDHHHTSQSFYWSYIQYSCI